MQVLVMLKDNKFYVSKGKDLDNKSLPTDYIPDDYWHEWEEVWDSEMSIDASWDLLVDRLWDLFGLGIKAEDE